MIGHDLLRISAALARHFTAPRGLSQSTKKRPKTTSSTEKKMTKNNAVQSKPSARRSEPNLDSRYGEIGISAVAAALPYQSDVKNPAYAPAVHQLDERAAEVV
jgi:hypothetical protein